MPRESPFQTHVVGRLRKEFPDCIIVKLDTGYLQGMPDRLVLIGATWFALEIKASLTSPRQPNQEYYVDKLYHMSYAAFICPENEDEVFDELQRTFQFGGAPRFPQP